VATVWLCNTALFSAAVLNVVVHMADEPQSPHPYLSIKGTALRIVAAALQLCNII
jgi:hypothetical protein